MGATWTAELEEKKSFTPGQNVIECAKHGFSALLLFDILVFFHLLEFVALEMNLVVDANTEALGDGGGGESCICGLDGHHVNHIWPVDADGLAVAAQHFVGDAASRSLRLVLHWKSLDGPASGGLAKKHRLAICGDLNGELCRRRRWGSGDQGAGLI